MLELTGRSAQPASVVLIVVGDSAGTVQRDPDSVGAVAGAGSLAWLAGRGSVQHVKDRGAALSHNAWQLNLLDTLDLDRRDYPSAPVTARGASDVDVAGYWLHADLVHLAAGLDSLTFARLTGQAAVTPAERQALAPLVAAHLGGSSLRLQVSDGGDWLMQSAREFDVITASPDAATANELGAVMPAGVDAGELRRMMTEWQMVLHEHPVSERRQRRGLPAINAIWPWGGGSVRDVHKRSLPTLFANDAFARGIGRMHDAKVRPLPTNVVGAVADERGQIVIVVDAPDGDQIEVDWIGPLVSAVRAKQITRLDVRIGEWHLHATAGMLRRFWRKPLPRTHWI